MTSKTLKTWKKIFEFEIELVIYRCVPLKLREQAEKVNDVPSGPLTTRSPPSPLLVLPPRFLSLIAYLTFSLIGIGLSNFNSTTSFTQSSGPKEPLVKSKLIQCWACKRSLPAFVNCNRMVERNFLINFHNYSMK